MAQPIFSLRNSHLWCIPPSSAENAHGLSVLEEEVPPLQSGSPSPQTNVSCQLEQMVRESLRVTGVLFGQGCRPLFSFLNNDFPCRFEFGGLEFTCATSAYEAQKFLNHPDLMRRFTALDGAQAYALSAEKHLLKIPTWYENRVDTMHHVLRAKFGQNRLLKEMLLLTTDAHLSLHTPYKNRDPFWTDDGDGSGMNQIGYLLMAVRQEYGGCGPVPCPSDYKELLPPQTSHNVLSSAIDKSDSEILAEIQELDASLKVKGVLFGQECKPPFSFLNNDFPCRFEFGGLEFTCATSAYEAQKFLNHPDLMRRFTALDGAQAYALSAEKHLLKIPTWYENRLDTMRHVLRAKFGQNHLLKEMLLLTADAHLSLHSSYKNMDRFWTNNGDGSGMNQMGYLLMAVRQEYGGRGPVPRPSDYKELLPPRISPNALPSALDKSDREILGEIEELNSRINGEEYKRHTLIARREENMAFTRFRFNNFPYDETLVPLSSGRFANASFVLGREFIGTQSPMQHTMHDFWSMVLEHNVPIVIMLNRLGDPGDDIYFPFFLGDKKKYGDIHLELMEEPLFTTDPSWRQSPHEEEPHAVIHRKIKIWRENDEPRLVHHFQYQNWRDFSAGNERAAAYLVQGVHAVRVENPSGPILGHCHAGVGRTSVIITLLEQYQRLLKDRSEITLPVSDGKIDIKRSVERQRSPDEGRCNSMMQATDQYHFCYRVLRLLHGALLIDSAESVPNL